MNIGLLIYSMEKAGGSERVTANLAGQLLSGGRKVSIICLYGTTSFFNISDKITYVTLENERGIINKAKALIKVINSNNFDYVIGISISRLNLYLSAVSFFLNKNIKLIASEHISFKSIKPLVRNLKIKSYKRFSKVVVLTDSDCKLLSDQGVNNVITISNASSYYPDSKFIKPILARPKVILAVGRLEYQKGFDLLIKAWAQIYNEYKDWKLHIVGEGSLKKEFESLIAKKFTDPEQCKILPFTNKMDEHYNNSQIFALSSRFEGLPMVMIEATCLGCALVSYDCETGPREIVREGYNGKLVPIEDVLEMSKQLATLINEPHTREQYFINQMDYRERYSMENIIKCWNDILI